MAVSVTVVEGGGGGEMASELATIKYYTAWHGMAWYGMVMDWTGAAWRGQWPWHYGVLYYSVYHGIGY